MNNLSDVPKINEHQENGPWIAYLVYKTDAV